MLKRSTMSSSLPPEVLDLVFDYLRDQPTTLKACCLVSKSWVHGTRRHLFVRVELSGKSLIRSWMRAFPDPSNSQAHHARSLSIGIDAAVLTGDPDARAFIRSFHNILQLFVHTFWWDTPKVTFADFHGLSPTLTSLHLFHPSIQSSEVLDLICSFPLLEDLSLQIEDLTGDLDGWVAPSASPKLTGELLLGKRVHHVVCGLLDLPGGLHFTKITACIPVEDAELVVGLVSRCSHTLESLWIDYYPSSTFLSAFALDWYLIATIVQAYPDCSPRLTSQKRKNLKNWRFNAANRTSNG